MHELYFFQKLVEEEIKNVALAGEPTDLYDPVRYMLRLGGKRIRPSLVLMSCEMFGGNYKDALSPALGIEVFHNFTLLHDDIMDKAPIRRSQQTVHTKWNADVAILSGDAMFVKSCQLMLQTDGKISRQVMEHFLETALLVCEGQQWDMTFQSKEEVSIEEYLKMIELKTAALLACSLKTGAMIGGASRQNQELIYDFGKNLGIAFQLHDDILDVYGNEEKFGKQTGGDILANKKTFLLLKAKELASEKVQAELNHWFNGTEFDSGQKVSAVKNIFQALGVKELAEKEMTRFFEAALSCLERVDVLNEKKSVLKNLAETLMKREH